MKELIKGTIAGLIVVASFWLGYYHGYEESNDSWLGQNAISGGYDLKQIQK